MYTRLDLLLGGNKQTNKQTKKNWATITVLDMFTNLYYSSKMAWPQKKKKKKI